MEGGGSPEAYIRAISLLKILDLAGRGNEKTAQYSPTWWRWKLLLCQAYYKYGVTYKDKAALDNVVRLVDGWITVNVLKNSPYYQDLNTLRTQADVERRKLG
jgi:hypothetical protein